MNASNVLIFNSYFYYASHVFMIDLLHVDKQLCKMSMSWELFLTYPLESLEKCTRVTEYSYVLKIKTIRHKNNNDVSA